MAENQTRHCAFDDGEVIHPTAEALRTIGRDDGNDENVFVHKSGSAPCGRTRLTESQTYTMGDVDPDDR